MCAGATLMLSPSHTGTFYTLSPSLALIFLHGATLRSLAYRWATLGQESAAAPRDSGSPWSEGRKQSLFTPLRLGKLMAIMAKFMIGNTPNIPSSQSGNVTLCVCRLEPRSRDSRPRPPLCHTQAAARQLYALLLRHCDREADSSLRGSMLCSASSSGMSCYNDCRNTAEN